MNPALDMADPDYFKNYVDVCLCPSCSAALMHVIAGMRTMTEALKS